MRRSRKPGCILNKKIRLSLADDHTILRKSLPMLLESQPDLEVVGVAGTGREAIDQALKLVPDVIVMDVSMPEMNGIEATRQICEALPMTRVVGRSMHKDAVYVREILRAGARGYLLKDSEDEDLLRAIRAVHRGEAFLSPAISDAVLIDYRKHVSNPIDQLTSREREIMAMIAEGKSNKEIAHVLNLSVYTVESHRGSVMEKLNLHNTGNIVIGGLLKQYTDGGAVALGAAEQHFHQVAQGVDQASLSSALGGMMRSAETPAFGQIVGQLFQNGSGDQNASMLNTLLAGAGPGLLSQLSGLIPGLGAGGTVTAEQAAAVPADAITQVAAHAEQHDPLMIDKMSKVYAAHPTLVKTLGATAMFIALREMG